MAKQVNLQNMILQIAATHEASAAHMQTAVVLGEVAGQLEMAGDLSREQELLDAFAELMRNGVLAWGYNLDNTDPPYFHITAKGQKHLKQL